MTQNSQDPGPVGQGSGAAGRGAKLEPPGEGSRIVDLFYQYFDILPALDERLRQEVYKLRYQVYCLETGFENQDACRAAPNTDGEIEYYEMDEFDQRSEHYLIRHKQSHLFAATTRLVLPDSHDPEALFPTEKHCGQIERVTDTEKRRRLGEISRYAVSRDFKRRAGEAGTIAGASDQAEQAAVARQHERRALPLLSMALWACMMRMAHRNSIRFLYGAMEPALFRLFQRNGIYFKPIGEGVDYHGLRIPCIIDLAEMVEDLKRDHHDNWELITNHGEFAWVGQ